MQNYIDFHGLSLLYINIEFFVHRTIHFMAWAETGDLLLQEITPIQPFNRFDAAINGDCGT